MSTHEYPNAYPNQNTRPNTRTRACSQWLVLLESGLAALFFVAAAHLYVQLEACDWALDEFKWQEIRRINIETRRINIETSPN